MIDSPSTLPQRLTSLDAFRGFAIAGMLLVNNPGTWDPAVVPRLLLHAEWHGCTFADLIFPFFLFAVGMAMPFSDARKREQGVPFWKCVLVAARRAIVLYLLGAFLKSASINLPVLHFGILQRIGVLYFAVYLILRLRMQWQAAIAVSMLFIWWAILAFVQAPGVIPGSFERDVNAAQYLDSFILAPDDKETIISMIPGISTVLFGVLAGRYLQQRKDHASVMRMLAIGAAAGIIIGLLWDLIVPLNKILWTSSFAVYTAGWSCLVFLLFILGHRGAKTVAPRISVRRVRDECHNLVCSDGLVRPLGDALVESTVGRNDDLPHRILLQDLCELRGSKSRLADLLDDDHSARMAALPLDVPSEALSESLDGSWKPQTHFGSHRSSRRVLTAFSPMSLS